MQSAISNQQSAISLALVLACFFILIATISALPAFAVKEFKVSQYNGGHQIWFEAEAFDERSPNKNYKLGIAEKVLKPADGAFGDVVTNAGGKGWLLYRFDISRAGGKSGNWRLIGRIINPNNHSDWLWVLGDDGDKIPEVEPAFIRPNHIIFENDTPKWTWVKDGDFGQDGGTVNKLQTGENVMMIWTRQSDLEDQYDAFVWADSLTYQPTDDDYKNASPKKGLAVQPHDRLTTIWGKLKSKSHF